MKILAFNSGGSTLKWKYFEVDRHSPLGLARVLARGSVDRIGGPGPAKILDRGRRATSRLGKAMAALDGRISPEGIV